MNLLANVFGSIGLNMHPTPKQLIDWRGNPIRVQTVIVYPVMDTQGGHMQEAVVQELWADQLWARRADGAVDRVIALHLVTALTFVA